VEWGRVLEVGTPWRPWKQAIDAVVPSSIVVENSPTMGDGLNIRFVGRSRSKAFRRVGWMVLLSELILRLFEVMWG